MPAFNIVRFRVKPGEEQRLIDLHRELRPAFKGFLGGHLVRTGDSTFCVVGEWRNFASIVAARPQMIALLDKLRGLLEDLGGGLGMTDPVSGESVLKLGAPRKAKKAARPRRAAKKKSKKRSRRA
jgi:quinol monooxygenase YgiN